LATQQKKYVVLFSAIGGAARTGYTRGAVLTAEQIGSEDEVQSKLEHGAIREATADEALHVHVAIVEQASPRRSYEAQLAEKDREINELRQRIAELSENNARLANELDALRNPPTPPADDALPEGFPFRNQLTEAGVTTLSGARALSLQRLVGIPGIDREAAKQIQKAAGN